MIYVKLFGNFKMDIDKEGKRISVPFPAKSSCVLAYILQNRKRAVLKEELIDIFWNDSSSANPVSAFKTLLFRIRGILNQYLGKNAYIIEENGSYQWNSEIEVEMDTEIFSRLTEEAGSGNLPISRKIALYQSARKLYQGEFLSNVRNVYWAEFTGSYYRSVNNENTLQLILLYKKEKDYKKMEQLCMESLKANYAEEDIYYYLIQAKIFQNKIREAKQVYEDAVSVLKNEMGAVYLEKLDSLKGKTEFLRKHQTKEIEAVCREIETQELSGTFVCRYPVFTEICRLEYRKMLREEFYHSSKEAARHILLLNLFFPKTEGDIGQERGLQEDMKKIEDGIIHHLRSGDVLSRCSASQFIFLLLGCSVEDCRMISQRIRKAVTQLKLGVECEIQYHRLTSGPINLKTRSQTGNHTGEHS